MANHLVNQFHIPDEEKESEEQIAYEKQILSQHYLKHASHVSSDEHTSQTKNDGSVGSSLRHHLKSFVKEVKATSQSAVRLVSLESRLTKELDNPARFPRSPSRSLSGEA